MKSMCFITGGTGYIGSHVAKYLLEKGWNVCLVLRKSSNLSNIEDIKDEVNLLYYLNINELIFHFNHFQPDVVFHIAAAVITKDEKDHIAQLIQSNVQFGTEILEAMRHSACRLFVNTGTYWQNYNSDTYNPVDLYAATKEAFEKMLQLYTDAYGIRAITLRLFDVFGEDDKRPKLWNLLKNMAGTDKVLSVSPGEQLMDLVHISDVCTAYETAYQLLKTQSHITNEIFSVQNDERFTLKQFVSMIQQTEGKEIHVDFGGKPYKAREVMIPMEHYKKLPNWETKIKAKSMFTLINDRGGGKKS
jgi:CDP-3, 6-dideoxy-D-glycero-L-glycero-4-hexulose-4-reductase